MTEAAAIGEARPRLVSRTRLINALADSTIGLIEAGGGYGKSVLASQYRQALGIATALVPVGPSDRDPGVFMASLRRALHDARLSDLASALDEVAPEAWVERLLDALARIPDGILLIVDDVHNLQGGQDSVEALLRFARGLPSRHRLLIASRSFAGALEQLWTLGRAARLQARDLAFTTAEATELVEVLSGRAAREHDVRMLVEATQGWITALILAIRAWALEERTVAWMSRDPVATALRSLLAVLAPADRDALVSLAWLPFFSPELIDAMAGVGGFDRLVTAGLPVLRTDTGWWEMPGPVNEFLASQGRLQPGPAQLAAGAYAHHGDELAAIHVLIAAGCGADGAQRLAAMAPHRAERFGLAVVREIVASLDQEAVAAHPRVLLHLARLTETAHLMDDRAQALEQAWGHASTAGSPDQLLLRELETERARDLMWDERTRAEARSRAERVLAQAGPEEAVTRARSLDILGRLGTWFSANGPQPEAESLLHESARLARLLGERTWAAQALVALGGGFYFALCRFDRALLVLEEALQDLPLRNRYRSMVQSFRADALTELGRFTEAEAAIDEMHRIGRAFAEDWLVAYALWNEALLASYRGDTERTVRAVSEALKHPMGWFDQPSGVEFLAQAADHLDRVGEHEQALRLLRAATDRMHGSEHLVHVHGAAISARSGDPNRADVEIERALSEWGIEPQEQWPLLLLRAYAAMRRGDPTAGELAAAAFDRCLELGHPRGPLIREPVVARSLLRLARESGSLAARELELAQGADSWTIQLLGRFALCHGEQQLALPPGRPRRAIQLLAISGGRLHHETLLELLWPGIAVTVGRNRLRNLLSRIRSVAEQLIVREGDVICLTNRCTIDAKQFETQAQLALSARSAGRPDAAAGLARTALDLYGGDLLPDEQYEDRMLEARDHLRSLQLDLLELVASRAEEEAEVDEAIRLIRAAILVDPYDERRHLTLARLLVTQGRTGSACAGLQSALASNEHWSPSARERLRVALESYRSPAA